MVIRIFFPFEPTLLTEPGVIVISEQTLHQDNMSVCFIPPYTPLLYSKTGVYRGLNYFLIFALKHILWVLIRIASPRRF